MKKRERKGFTIVELVIVIAIVAVLAGILIPTFASLIDKANQSADIQAAKQLNDALAVGSIPDRPTNFKKVIEILADAGYNSEETLVPITKGYKFFWYEKHNVIVLAEFPEEFGAITLDTFIDGNTVKAKVLYPSTDSEAAQEFSELLNSLIVVIRSYQSGNGNNLPSSDYLAGHNAEFKKLLEHNLEKGLDHLNDYVENPDDNRYVAVTGIEMERAISVSVGGTYTLTATVSPDNASDKTITWSSDKESVATVVDGVITAHSSGIANITAKADSVTATCTVTVSDTPVSGVLIQDKTLFLHAGVPATIRYTANLEGETDKSLTWSSDKEDVATVDASGKVTAVSSGVATITLSTASGKTDTATVVVLNVTLPNETPTIMVGDTHKINVTIDCPEGYNVNTVFSCESDVVSVSSSDGIVTGLKYGSATITITVKCNNVGVYSSSIYTVNVESKVGDITILPDDASANLFKDLQYIYTGQTATLNASATTEDSSQPSFIWTTTTSDVIEITNQTSGTVTITTKKAGSASITATVQDGSGKSKTFNFEVVAQVGNITITIAKNTLFVNEESALTYEVENPSSVESHQWTVTADHMNEIISIVDGNKVKGLKVSGETDAVVSVVVTDKMGAQTTKMVTLKVISAISGLEVAPSDTQLVIVGDEKSSAQLVAVPTVAAGVTDPGLVWTSQNTGVATVDENGKVTAVANGEAVITVASKDNPEVVLGQCTVTVTTATLSFAENSVELYENEEKLLSVNVYPAGTSYTFESEDEEIASIDANGKVNALKAGETTITVTTADGLTATCTVIVKVRIDSVTIQANGSDVDSVALHTNGATQQLTAVVTPDTTPDKRVTWSSSNTAAVTVDENGLVTAIGNGTAIITAKSTVDPTKEDTCTVTVSISVTGVSLDKTSLALNKDETATLTATVNPGDAANKNLSWSSSNETVATVEDGVVKALSSGTATITVTTEDGSKTATCNVTVSTKVEGVTLDKTSLELKVGDAPVKLTATVNPGNADNKNVSWNSSNSAVATVDSSGNVTALSSGTTTITVTTADGNKTATCEVTVKVKVTSVSLNNTSLSLDQGATATLIATVLPANANQNVVWSSDNTEVARVDQSGKVTAVGGGTAIITVTTVDGTLTATCAVSVKVVATSAEDINNAINNATGNVSIKLNDDIALDTQLLIEEGANVVIDLNGKELTAESAITLNGGNLNIIGGEINTTTASTSYINVKDGEFTANGVTFNLNNSMGNGITSSGTNSVITLENCTIVFETTNSIANAVSNNAHSTDNGTIILNNTTLISNKTLQINNGAGGYIELNNVTASGSSISISTSGNGAKTVINGGSYTSESSSYMGAISSMLSATVELNGCTITLPDETKAISLLMGTVTGTANIISDDGKYTWKDQKLEKFSEYIITDGVLTGIKDEYKSTLTEVVIPAGVTEIADGAFANNSTIKSVRIDGSVTTIGDNAFENCDALTEVYIGTSVTTIGTNVFKDCTSVKNVTIPYVGGNSSIPVFGYLFGATKDTNDSWYGGNLTVANKPTTGLYVTILDGATEIGDFAFLGCYGYNIKSLDLPDSITKLGDYSIADLTKLTEIPNISNVTHIGQWAFRNYTVTNITISNKVTYIGPAAFAQCKNLNSLTIPKVGASGTLVSMFSSTDAAYMPATLNVTITDASIDPDTVFAGCADWEDSGNGTYKITVRN